MAKQHWLDIIRSEVQATIAVSGKRELTGNEKKLLDEYEKYTKARNLPNI
jgi:hypothetical protein